MHCLELWGDGLTHPLPFWHSVHAFLFIVFVPRSPGVEQFTTKGGLDKANAELCQAQMSPNDDVVVV